MGTLIAGWTTAVITLLTAAVFLRLYFTSKLSPFYKRKWVIAVCCVLVLSSVAEIGNAHRNEAQRRIPTKGELQDAIAAHNTLADEDVVYQSPDGYSLTVPAGYAYTTFPSGAVSMTAVKKQSTGQSAIVVAKQQSNEDLESIVKETIDVLKKRNPAYAFSSGSEILLGDRKAIRVDLDVEKEGVPIRGIFIFAKAGDTCFELMLSSPATSFPQESAVFEKVIQSSRLR